jgi:hypothetical protein
MAKKSKAKERPLPITVISVLGFISGGLLTLLGIMGGSLGAAISGVDVIFGPLLATLGIVLVAIGVVELVASYFLWKMDKKGLWLTVLISLLSLVTTLPALATAFNSANLISFILTLVIVGYLLKIREQFS